MPFDLELKNVQSVKIPQNRIKREIFVKKFSAFTDNCLTLTSAQHHLINYLADLMHFKTNIVHFPKYKRFAYVEKFNLNETTVERALAKLKKSCFIYEIKDRTQLSKQFFINPYYFANGDEKLIKQHRKTWDTYISNQLQ